MPSGHCVGVVDGIAQKCPAGHVVQADAPPALNVPARQGTGAELGLGQRLPAGH